MLMLYITVAVIVFAGAATAAVMMYEEPSYDNVGRRAALIAITCWAWPIWAAIALAWLTRYALEPYLVEKED